MARRRGFRCFKRAALLRVIVVDEYVGVSNTDIHTRAGIGPDSLFEISRRFQRKPDLAVVREELLPEQGAA